MTLLLLFLIARAVATEQASPVLVLEPSAVVLVALGCVLTYGEACRRSRRV